ncbi:MAG: ferredoxin [Frankiales bacterium]|nr:ferredoxin [Frankiales bacterium]
MPRIVVDEDLCQGHAMCSLEAPDVFEVPKHGTVQLIGDITASHLEAVRLAVRHCPTGALALEED